MASSATDSDAAAHGGEQAVGMPQLDFDTWASQIFWAALALVLLYQILAKKIMPRIAGALEDRHHAIAGDLDSASTLKAKAEEAQGAYQKALSDAKARAHEIAEKNRAELNVQIAEANEKAEAEIAARTAEGEERIAAIRAEATANAREVAGETAKAIVDKLAPGSADPSAISAAVERALAERGMV